MVLGISQATSSKLEVIYSQNVMNLLFRHMLCVNVLLSIRYLTAIIAFTCQHENGFTDNSTLALAVINEVIFYHLKYNKVFVYIVTS